MACNRLRSITSTSMSVLATAIHVAFLARLQFAGVRPTTALLITILAAIETGPRSGAIIGLALGLQLDLFLDTRFGVAALVLSVVGAVVGGAQAGAYHGARLVPTTLLVVASLSGALALTLLSAIFGVPSGGISGLFRTTGVVSAWNFVLAPLLAPVVRAILEFRT